MDEWDAWLDLDARTARLGLDDAARAEVLECARFLAEAAEARGVEPGAVIGAAARFAEAFGAYRGAAFCPRVSRHRAAGGARVCLIEPPIGCSLCLIEAGDAVVMVDSGFRCFQEELLAVIRAAAPDFAARRRVALLTHADVDHCGVIGLADEAWMSVKCRDAFVGERQGRPNLRERDPVQGAYERMIKRLSGYETPPLQKMRAVGGTLERPEAPLTHIGDVAVNGLRFEAWEGRGGHVAGECVYIERAQRLAFTGDIYCKLKSFSPEQAAFNALGPKLMGRVDADPIAARAERSAIFERLGAGEWLVFGGHGGVMAWEG